MAASWGAGPGKVEQWQLLTRARALDSTTYRGRGRPGRPGGGGRRGAPGVRRPAWATARRSARAANVLRARRRAGAAGRRPGPGRRSPRPGGDSGAGQPPSLTPTIQDLAFREVRASAASTSPRGERGLAGWALCRAPRTSPGRRSRCRTGPRCPTDPLARTAVDPSWAPPEPARRWWIPLVIFVVIGALIGAAAYAGARVGLGNAPDGGDRVSCPPTVRRATSGSRPPASCRHDVRLPGHRVGAVHRVTGLLSTDTSFGTQHAGRDPRRAGHDPDLANDHHRDRQSRPHRTEHPALPDHRRGGTAGGEHSRAPATSTRPRWSSCRPTSDPGQQWTGTGSASDDPGLSGATSVPRPATTAA